MVVDFIAAVKFAQEIAMSITSLLEEIVRHDFRIA